MENSCNSISEICHQLMYSCERIRRLSLVFESTADPDVADMFRDMLVDKTGRALVQILKITELVTAEAPAFSGEVEEDFGGAFTEAVQTM